MTLIKRVLNLLSSEDKAAPEKKRLHEAEEKYRNLFDNTGDAAITSDPEDVVTSWNPGAEKIFGWKAQEAIGKKLSALIIPPSLKGEKEQLIHEAMSGMTVTRINTVRLHRDWITRINVNLILSPILDANQNLIGLSYIIKDLTERRQAENALKESEERFKAVMQSAADAVILSDSIGNIISWNRGAETIFQYSKEEMMGKQISILIPRRYRFSHDNGLMRVTSTGESRIIGKKVEMYGMRKDGNEFPMELSLATWKSGKTVFYSGIIRDVTERKKSEEIQSENIRLRRLADITRDTTFVTDRKKAEEVRRENRRFELESKAESDFLARMSHELRTPLNSVVGFCELLKQKIHGDLNKKQEQYLDKVIASSKFLLDIINDLDLRMVDAGKVELVIEKMSVPETINETITLVAEKALKQNVSLRKDIDLQLDFIEADRKRVKLILFNLLSNAVKFSKKEGGIVTVTAKKERDMAKFQVSDTGIGIREEDIEKLFNKFQQLDSGCTRKFEGAGLGLAISRQLVELQGGKIMVESKYGEGTTFTVLLPIV